MGPSGYDQLVERQKTYFNRGLTRNPGFRKKRLAELKAAVEAGEARIMDALKADLGKPAYEAYMTEIGLVLNEIRFVTRRLKSWARPRRVRTPWIHFPASSHVHAEPYGSALVISPWNYPFQLALSPLIASMSAGNCTVLKPSEHAPNTSRVIEQLLGSIFDEAYIAVCEGEVETSRALLEQPFDYIFFTGSATVAKVVMAAAARHLTPVTLELGGKSPCIVDREVNVNAAARRIVSGKFTNAGQTCVAPDYLLVHEAVKTKILEKMGIWIHKFFGRDPQQSPDYARIVNRRHFDRLTGLLQGKNVIFGGQSNPQQLYIAPTLVDDVSWEDSLMGEEIFGPILPVISFHNFSEALNVVKARTKPLALYFFSTNSENCRAVIRDVPFGGGCINDTLLHVANPHLPFGGIGPSGMGTYHGKAGFDTFSHLKAIIKKSSYPDFALRYPPYRNRLKLLKKILH